jgi:hypothetical protein
MISQCEVCGKPGVEDRARAYQRWADEEAKRDKVRVRSTRMPDGSELGLPAPPALLVRAR